jgi:putative ABC transport system permease protein
VPSSVRGRFRRGLTHRYENVASAFRSIRELKLRSFLTCLGIIIGVATVIVMVSLVNGFNQGFIGAFQQFGATLVQFQLREEQFGGPPREDDRYLPPLTLADAEAIRRYAWAIGVVSPERWKYSDVDLRFMGKRMEGPVVGGVEATYPEANNHYVGQGRFFSPGEQRHSAQVCIVGKGIVETLMPRLDPLQRRITIQGHPFTIIGVFEAKGGFLGDSGADNQVVIPMGQFDAIWPEVAQQQGLVIATIPRQREWVNLAIEQGTQILRERRGLRFDQPNNFAVRTPERMIRIFKSVTSGISAAVIVIAGISLVIGGVGVMNIMLMNVTQRTREIGIRKAVGARRRDILQQFLTEAITLSLVGGVAGILIGLGIAFVIGKFSPLPASISPWAIASGLVMATLVGLFFGTYPAWRAARLDPIDALRYE